MGSGGGGGANSEVGWVGGRYSRAGRRGEGSVLFCGDSSSLDSQQGDRSDGDGNGDGGDGDGDGDKDDWGWMVFVGVGSICGGGVLEVEV